MIALTRAVSPDISRCELTHHERVSIDAALTTTQHDSYEQLLTSLGCTVVRIPALPELPDSVFVEDCAVVLNTIAIITRPGAASRRTETLTVADSLLKYRALHCIQEPGTLDGGDVLVAGKKLFVGRSGRTNNEAHEQLARMVRLFGYQLQSVDFDGCLHLKSAVTRVSDDLLLVNPAFVDPANFAGFDIFTVDKDEPDAANALCVGDVVVYPKQHELTRKRLEQHGLEVQTVDISELAKAEAGVTCCCILVD